MDFSICWRSASGNTYKTRKMKVNSKDLQKAGFRKR